MSRRPRVISPCVADRYHAHTERIIEFSGTGDLGGLISISERVPGTIVIDVYRTIGRVIVIDRTKP